jgi:hypothetical protein
MPRFRDFGFSRFCGLVLLVTGATPAVAAPFCIRTQALSPQCIYYDAGQCQTEAFRQGGVCTVNTAEVHLKPGIGQYCMVTSSVVSLCAYADRGTCAAEATRHHGACVEGPGIAPGKAPDPYAAVGGR